MLQRHGHDVSVFVLDTYSGKPPLPNELMNADEHPVKLVKAMPFGHLVDYQSAADLSQEGDELADKVCNMLLEHLTKDKCDIVFTHDLIFTGWNLPHSIGIRKASPHLPHLRWLHWVHSVPSSGNDWWSIRSYGGNHRIIFPNQTDRIRVAEQFRGTIDSVRIIPHIKDIRTFFDFQDETCRFIDCYPGVMQSEIVSVYPASTDRLAAKGLDKVIGIIGELKKFKISVCLVCANQWATGKARKEDITEYERTARDAGLVVGEEFIFSSTWNSGKYDTGLPREILRELMMLSNLFIFPTREESFGLVGPEISLASGALMVLNKSLPMMAEIHGFNGIFCDFGSFVLPDFVPVLPWPEYMRELAKLIISRIREQESIRNRTHIRKRYNMDYIYSRYYAPVISEAVAGWLP